MGIGINWKEPGVLKGENINMKIMHANGCMKLNISTHLMQRVISVTAITLPTREAQRRKEVYSRGAAGPHHKTFYRYPHIGHIILFSNPVPPIPSGQVREKAAVIIGPCALS